MSMHRTLSRLLRRHIRAKRVDDANGTLYGLHVQPLRFFQLAFERRFKARRNLLIGGLRNLVYL